MPTHIVLTAIVCFASAPCEPTMVRVWDGDTAWFGETKIRIAGYDAPEFATRSRCASEANLAKESRERLSRALSAARKVQVEPTGAHSYDRVVAHVLIDGEDVGTLLVREGLATHKRHDRADWCR